MPTATRTLTYTGPQAWLDTCAGNSFIAVECSPKGEKKVESRWHDAALQELAATIPANGKDSRLTFNRTGIDQVLQLRFGVDAPTAKRAARLIADSLRRKEATK